MANNGNFSGRGRRIRTAILLLSDMVCMFGAWVLAVLLASALGRASFLDWFPLSTTSGIAYTAMTLAVVLSLAATGQYGRRSAFWEETRVIWRHAVMAGLVNFALNFFVQVSFNRTVPLLAWLCVLVMVPTVRLLAREWLVSMGWWKRRALLVGDGANALEASNAMHHERHMGLEVVGTASAADLEIEGLAQKLGCETIVVALDDSNQSQAAQIVGRLHAARFEIFVVPALQGLPVQGMQAQYFFSNDVLFLRLQHKLFSRSARLLKRSIDVVASLALLIGLSPLMAWVAWRIWREDGGPVLYSHARVGASGGDFGFIKFRSMVTNADAVLADWQTNDPVLYARYQQSNFKLADDPRILRVGSLIRRTSIDELPQLWNVLRGDMSLVGPRPLLRRELPAYEADAMELYLQVKPGITGLWQVSGRSDTTFQQRSAMDSWYVRNWSLWVDWVILLKTVRVVLSGQGAI